MPATFSRIIVPVDFSPLARKALGHAFALATATTRVELVHVSEPLVYPHPSLWTGGLARLSGLMEQTQMRAKQSLEALRKELAAAHPVEVSSTALTGQPAETIAEHARTQEAELLVVATHGRSGLSQVLLGSVTERLLHLSTCPVLVARRDTSERPVLKRLLVAVDRSEHSGRALQLAAQIALRFGAKIEVVHVWAAPFFGEAEALDGDLFEKIRETARQDLEAFVASLSLPASVDLQLVIVPGDVGSALQHHIAKQPPDLLVVGTHGRGGFKRLVLGSVAQSAVRYSPCSALVVP